MGISQLVAIDEGNGFTKVRSLHHRLSFPSVIAIENATVSDFRALESASDKGFVMDFEGKRWAVGQAVHTHGSMPIRITHRSRTGTDYYRMLFAAALAAGLQQSATVSAIVSLPPAAYWDKETQKNIIAGDYVVGIGDQKLKFVVPRENLQVVPEGFGTAMTFCLDSKGRLQKSEIFEQEIGIVDVGTLTTDFLQFSNMTLVRRGTDSLNHALSGIHAKVKGHCDAQGVDVDLYKVDEILRQGYFLKAGRRQSIATERRAWSGELAQVIGGQIRTLWGGGDAVEHILITGGGAPYVGDLLGMEFPHVRLLDPQATGLQPWEHNCEGSYRFALFLQAAREQQG